MVRSSWLKIWPLIVTDFPIIADPREDSGIEIPGVAVAGIAGLFSLLRLLAGAGAEFGFGVYSSSLRLFHIGRSPTRSVAPFGSKDKTMLLPLGTQAEYEIFPMAAQTGRKRALKCLRNCGCHSISNPPIRSRAAFTSRIASTR